MKNTDELENEAALYALGLLDPQSASRFEELLAGDAAALEALKPYSSAPALMAESLEPVAPPPGIKKRLFATLTPPKDEHAEGLGAVRSSEGKWKAGGVPGISYKTLYRDQASGLVTRMVRMEPGAVYPAHRHSRTEQCLVIEGDLIHDDHVYHPGDFTWAVAGTIDPSLQTQTGALLLIISGMEPEERV